MPDVFSLENVTIDFRCREIEQRTLKGAIAEIFRHNPMKIFRALEGITMNIADGEHIGLIGRNGAGKSTLLRVLAGVIEPQKGKVFRNPQRHIVPLLELGIGFQPDLSGMENCFLAGVLMGYTKEDIARKIPAIASFAELNGFMDQPIKTYSSGMHARLAFALATDVEPEVLLVDETFGVGDEFFMRKCIVRMQKLMRHGTTTVFVSHNLDFLVAQCDRLIWIDQGRIVIDGNPERVAESYRACDGRAEHFSAHAAAN